MPRKPAKPRRGRPRKTGLDATAVVHVRLDGRDRAKLDRLAGACDPPTAAEAVRRLIRDAR